MKSTGQVESSGTTLISVQVPGTELSLGITQLSSKHRHGSPRAYTVMAETMNE